MQIIISAWNVTLITSLLPSLANRGKVCPHKREGSQGNQKAVDEHSYLFSVIQYLTDANNLNSSGDTGVFYCHFLCASHINCIQLSLTLHLQKL